MRRTTAVVVTSTFATLLVLAGCGHVDAPDAPPVPVQSSASAAPSARPSEPAPEPTAPAAPDDQIVGTVVRFSSGETSIDVTIGEDNPTVRDFLSILPVTTTVEEFAGREKIASFDRRLDTAGSPGSDPEDGDLIYFIPWGNLGFYYDTSGIGYSDQTVHIGTYDAGEDELAALEGGDVTVRVVP